MHIEIKLPDIVGPIKEHVARHKTAYLIGSFVVVAGITYLVVRKMTSGQDNVTVRSFNILSNHPSIVTMIESNRQGPPSWVVRCLDTGEWFSSQRAAALANGIYESHLSQHLNGLQDHVNGLHFERVCIAA